MAPARLVADDRALDDLIGHLCAAREVSVDCEQNGLHAYRARVCLVQVSTEKADWIVDPLGQLDMSRLAPVMADPDVTKVFHAAEEDVIGLARDFGLGVSGLFDTMWAAKMLGWPRLGLAPILEERYGVVLDKRMQRHDWGRRPLDERALAYAQLDTHFLIDLYRRQEAELARRGRTGDAHEVFAELAESRAIVTEPEPWAYRLKGERDLTDRGRAVAHALADVRDEQARRRDKPPFKIIGDREIVAIAAARPTTMPALRAVESVPQRLVERHGAWLLAAVARGSSANPPARPPKRPRDDAAAARYEAMRRWRNHEAARHGVSGEVIVPNDALRAIARAVPATVVDLESLGVLGPRRLAAYGQGLVDAMGRAGRPPRSGDTASVSDGSPDPLEG